MDDPWPALPPDWNGGPASTLHVIRVPLVSDDILAPVALPELSAEEVRRAERYVVERPRRQFVITRRALRQLCGRLLRLAPQNVTFEFMQFGKPAIAAAQNPQHLAFNVTHSGDWAVIALGWRRRIGVDVETHEPNRNWRGLAERFFSEEEQRQLFDLPESLHLAGFYRIWTTKEAYLKATGMGMSCPLQSFTVAADPRNTPHVKHVTNQPDAAATWLGASFAPGRDVYGALLWDSGPATVSLWTWPGVV